MSLAILKGKLPAALANDISDAIHRALTRGMDVDEVVCIAAAVLADYARHHYGNEYLQKLAVIIQSRKGEPMPDVAGR